VVSAALERGDAIPDSLAEIASRCARAIRTAHPKGPYRLGGWSFGGLLAHEIAQALSREGDDVAVALLDAHVDSIERAGESPAETLSDMIAAEWGEESARGREEAYGRIERVAQAHHSALARYRPAVGAWPSLLIRAGNSGGALGWSTLAGGRFDVVGVETDHFDLLRQPVVAQVADHLRAWLDRIDRRSETGQVGTIESFTRTEAMP
jgi:thioesterase domain-containing protein